MKVISIVGARPQFIKAALLCKLLRERHQEVLVHTGQHYDENMSDVFFREMDIPEPEYNLEVGSGPHGQQTAEMLVGIERVLVAEKPDLVLIYGDTNSTLAGALAAVKLCIPVAHVEAGLRSFNRTMPEEINRVLADRASDLLFCPTVTAVENLRREGITRGVHLVGDVMYDAALYFGQLAEERSTILNRLGLQGRAYLLATVHRPHSTDDAAHLKGILTAFGSASEPIVFPVHPRTRRFVKEHGLEPLLTAARNLLAIDPVSYLDMLQLEKHARAILTDSGGVQKEAYFFGVPCITMRTETEWVETVADGWNCLVGTDAKAIAEAIRSFAPKGPRNNHYGDGTACEKIVAIVEQFHAQRKSE
ncbi:MAG: UDP-N-acetylglucosamine 2-epimerase (non-hydrolyzing) [candidate division KSB1 bacterium]|nr:UDP-N-acetylglucosamine 2-epimerase (non-hydrolyzing) [candidate division KSB1 bacterium]MDZ7293862.1 UDP-N-acetylglucosamine 2-epimerase (non-hydrolyzing) [candidate division KSB1 bacterium]MDZ7377886.1 UDP-N-acetylglucosamine 2-epimerase (non-hydrolyzing) [candidate division KSB1 bacterium]MDZ7385695.1 UDP-N-acetylglucosamine 2-epimerase (non-hydrolyzing) [candidate division KSB1 bacterium]MDZ7391596.1 UDP-N-acetylglucosamine 2-epimerase (non-hydrolyzing) [candidate division KSB1 bacterium